nr:hypothetical protein [Pseudomonas luteola]
MKRLYREIISIYIGTILSLVLMVFSQAQAETIEVPKGVIMLRADAYGAKANDDKNYTKDERRDNDILERVSALCGSSEINNARALIESDETRKWDGYMIANSTSVLKIGGKVVRDPLDNNPNHCLINDVKLSKLKGIWSAPR